MTPHSDRRGGYLELLRVAYPLIFMSASHVIMQFADRKFLSQNATADMAAALPSGILFFTLFVFFTATCGFTSTMVAQWYGKGNPKECVRSVWAGVWFAAGAGVIIVTVLPWIAAQLLRWSLSPTLLPRALDYLKGLIPSGAFMCLSMPFFAFFSGRGKTPVVAAINIFICAANILLNWLFIFGKCGFPKWGIFGAGVATSLSGFCGLAVAVGLYLAFDQRKYPTRRYRKFNLVRIGKLVRFGMPAGMQVLSDLGCFSGIILIVGQLGDTAVAACSIAFTVNNLSFLPLTGVADATAILAGQYIGKSELGTAARIPGRGLRIALSYMLLTAILYLGFPEWIAHCFRPGDGADGMDFAAVVRETRWVLMTAALWNFADCFKFVCGGLLRGAGDTRALMLINLFCSWVLVIPGILLLVFVFRPPVAMVWAYLVLTSTIEAYLVRRRCRVGKWRQIGLVRR